MGELAKIYEFPPRDEIKEQPRKPTHVQIYFVPEEQKIKTMRPNFLRKPRPWYEGLMDGTGVAILFIFILMLLSTIFWHLKEALIK